MVIGRALMSLPRTLLSDEPSGGLAPRFVQEIARIMCGGVIVIASVSNVISSGVVPLPPVSLTTGAPM